MKLSSESINISTKTGLSDFQILSTFLWLPRVLRWVVLQADCPRGSRRALAKPFIMGEGFLRFDVKCLNGGVNSNWVNGLILSRIDCLCYIEDRLKSFFINWDVICEKKYVYLSSLFIFRRISIAWHYLNVASCCSLRYLMDEIFAKQRRFTGWRW